MTVVDVVALCVAAVVVAAMLCSVAVAVAVWWTRHHWPGRAQRLIADVAGRRGRRRRRRRESFIHEHG